MPAPKRTTTIIDPETDCWLWQGPVDGYGHPITSFRGRVMRVQHLNFEKQHGVKAKRLKTKCGINNCVNPAHLVEASSSELDIASLEKILKCDLDPDTRAAVENKLVLLKTNNRTVKGEKNATTEQNPA